MTPAEGDAGLGHFRRTDGANPTDYEEWWRAGHDHRYAINASKLGSRSHVDFRDNVQNLSHFQDCRLPLN